MKNTWKTLIAALALAVSATMVSAEAHLLHSHKYWSVSYVDYQGSIWCSAEASLKNGTTLSINTGADRVVNMQVFVPDRYWKDSYAKFSFQIDNRQHWTDNNANYYENSIFVTDINATVVRQLAEGNEIHLYNYKGDYVTSLSLAGSKAAMYALAECQQKLGPVTRAQF